MALSREESPEYSPTADDVIDVSSTPIKAEVVDEGALRQFPFWPLVLFLATCYTTTTVGEAEYPGQGWLYSMPVMAILLCHEFGHYLQARRYRVPASLPYFIPVPFPPLGTMGAVIGMRSNSWNRKELFDIGISGPLAGLVPAIVFCVVGLRLSSVVDVPPVIKQQMVGAPLLFRWLAEWILHPPAGTLIDLHPIAYAGWVGIFITALNLMPISQLDGGHVLYALLRRKAHIVASLLLAFAIVAVLLTQNYQWSLMLFLLLLIGPNHPPTANDHVPLGTGRTILGWVTLAFVIIGFTPTPFSG
ncbi:MAG: site-2 protease family protein [Pirellulales bacterium]